MTASRPSGGAESKSNHKNRPPFAYVLMCRPMISPSALKQLRCFDHPRPPSRDLFRGSIHCVKSQSGLSRQDQWKSKAEVPMPRFVVKQAHSNEPADGTAQQRKEKKHLFGDPPALPFRFALVQPHREARGKIHSGQIERQDIFFINIHNGFDCSSSGPQSDHCSCLK